MKPAINYLFLLILMPWLNCGWTATPETAGAGSPVGNASATLSRDPELTVRVATVQAGHTHCAKGNPGLNVPTPLQTPLVTFAAPWTSPFRVDAAFPHYLVNREGEHLLILNKTAWAYFGCQDPGGFLDRARSQGVNVIRVALEGRPYWNELNLDLWPWGGTRAQPDWSLFDESYWQRVEERVRWAGEKGIGLDVVLYFTLHPDAKDIVPQRSYWEQILRRLGKYANVLTWEIANEYTRNEIFQDTAGQFFKERDPQHRPVCTSDGTTDDAVWPAKSWMDLAINHTCTSSTPRHDLRDWYLAVARNTRAHGKPAWCNESGREQRYRNDDGVHRRKQGWLWYAAGCFWTWHSWDGCEGINDRAYRAPGEEFLRPMVEAFRALPFWRMNPNQTAALVNDPALVQAVMATPERDCLFVYCCTRETGKSVSGTELTLCLPDGAYRVSVLKPADGLTVETRTHVSKGLGQASALALPPFVDDLAVRIERTQFWWMDQPIRLLQTNLRETDSTLDARRLVQQVADFPANALLFNMGGIVAQYPTRVAFHYASPHLPPGRDLFGDVLHAAHARGIRVIGRFDLSKTQKPVFDAHPEWFFKRTNGEPAIYNGLYSACINGGYYREHAIKILTEALENYAVDGLFFNMFGNPSSDYSGNPMGPCRCDACQTRFQARYRRPLPTHSRDPNYGEFLAESAREVAAMFADLIHRLRPQAAFLTYIQDYTDGIMSESNTAVGRALPLWPYSASDNINRARSSEPDKMAFNLCMSFVDYPWRFVTVPPAEIQLRLHQSLAHGGALALNMHGTLDQEDRQALLVGRPVFQWHARHEDLYVGQQNAARILLLRGETPAYRGFFRLLSEQHIPFVVSDNLKWLTNSSRRYDLVIAPSGAPAELEAYVRNGGRLLTAGANPPALPVGKVIGRRDPVQATWRIHDHSLLPSLTPTKLLFLDGAYVELAPLERPLLTLIPPAMFGPPEKVWVDKVETTIPGLVLADHGAGRIGYIPWDVGGLYYRHSSPGHAGLMADVIDHLLPTGRQLRTSAHPLVEITVMQQPSRKRLLVHFVNLSGHADTAYFAPIEMRDISVELAHPFRHATAMRLDQKLQVTDVGKQRRFVLPRLETYEVVVLDE